MPTTEVTLEVASFCDSPQAQALTDVSPKDVRRIAEIFVELCYEDLGKKPRLLDGQDVHSILGHLMPGRLKRKDPVAAHVPIVIAAYFDHLEATQVVPQGFEMRHGLESTISEFLDTVRTGENRHHHGHHRKQAPVVHQAPKLGRNDPCFCGSGKKFKKCCGKNE